MLKDWRSISLDLLRGCWALIIDKHFIEQADLRSFKKIADDFDLPIIFCDLNKNSTEFKKIFFWNSGRKYDKKNREERSLIKLTDGVTFDVKEKALVRNRKIIPLSNIEYKILMKLTEKRNEVCSVEELIDFAWGYEEVIGTDSLYVHIHNLREKIEDIPKCPKIIKTRRGKGYSLLSIKEKEHDFEMELK